MPDDARPFSLALMQASSVIGNCTAALLYWWLGELQLQGKFDNLTLLGFSHIKPWRILFVVGIVPALLAVLVQTRLREPEKWRLAVAAGHRKPSFGELLGNSRWRRNAMFGLLLAISGVVGLWAIGFFSIDLQKYVLEGTIKNEAAQLGLTAQDAKTYIDGQSIKWTGITSLAFNIGAFFGVFAFAWVTFYFGRRIAFAIALILAAVSTAGVFMLLKTRDDIIWMVPIMGFFQLALFGGYAIYFPELFPTRLRSTGTSFCYNVGRLASAFGPTALGLLTSKVYFGYAEPMPMRLAGVTMCSIFLVGLIALPFLPETRGKPLPEEQGT